MRSALESDDAWRQRLRSFKKRTAHWKSLGSVNVTEYLATVAHREVGKNISATLRQPVSMRNEARLTLIACGLLNALTFQIDKAISEYGLIGAVANTFGISIIAWAAFFASAVFVTQEKDRELCRREIYTYSIIVVIFLMPVNYFSWVGLTVLSLSILHTSQKGSSAAKAGWILLAVTFPMFWSKLIFSLLSDILLQFDAVLVSSVLAMPRSGNTITLADGQSQLFIAPACSSMANVSLVVLCWTIFCQFGQRKLSQDYLWCIGACCAIVSINVCRISLIGLFPQHYDLLHGAVGASAASWVILLTMVSIFRFGMTRGA